MLGRARQVIDYLFFLLYALLSLRILLALVDANEQAGFVRFVRDVTGPFYAPFSDIVDSIRLDGGMLDVSALIALFVYGLLHAAVRKLLHVFAGPQPVARTRQL
ncbi:MAG: YggT family protein [Gemmatimonadota bacterium]